jgi:TonB-dependent starch-binding outer membrane protein SusC
MSCRIFLRVSVLCAMLLISLFSFSQDKVITGKVTDSKDGSSLNGVTVSAKGTTTAVQTKTDGTYSISVANSVTTLIFTSVGFVTQELAIDGRTSLNVTLAVNNAALGEIVVVAYGTRRRGDLTGAVTSISAKDFQKGNINSPEQLLQGKVAGLQVTSGGGTPGGGSRIRIRGGASLNSTNDPLIVIDGVPVEGNGIAGSGNILSTINPNDIESMSVLKDASATVLYGSRASNGVLIITTKKGAKGKVKFTYSTLFSVGTRANEVDILTGDQIREIINADAAATGNNIYKNLLGTANTDWQDEVYHSAIGFDNTIAASGSVANMPFRVSIGYLNQDGLIKTSNFKRYSTAINLTPKFFKDHLSVQLSVKASHIKNRFADEGRAVGGAVTFDPSQPVLSGNKNWGGYYEWLQSNGAPIDLSNRNPVAALELRDNRSKVNRVIGNVQLDYKLHFFPDLHIRANIGIDRTKGSGDDHTDSTAATDYKTRGRFVHYEEEKTNTLIDAGLFYAKEIKSIRSKIDVLAMHSYQTFRTERFNFASFGQDGVMIPGSTPTFPTDPREFRLESYLGQINISVHDKYLFTASIRSDASSKLNPKDRTAYFPGAAFAWRLKEEFFKTTNVLTDLKLRLSWGNTGQQDGIDNYSYLPRYTQGSSTVQYLFGNTWVSYLRPEGYDANIKWEATTAYNAGVDFGFLNGRITGTADYFFRKTKDLLANVTFAPGSNFINELVTNVGNVESKGFEFTINTIPVRTKNLTWELGVNYTYLNAEITNLLRNPDPNFKGQPVSVISGGTGNRIGIHGIGHSPYTYNVYKQIYDNDGKPIEGLYEDINRDGIVNDDDRYLYKKPAADVLIGLNTQLNYKQFSFGLAAHGAFGNYVYNNYFSNAGVLRAIKNPINFIANASTNYLDTRFENNQYLSDYYVENASFFRLDNINFGWNVGSVLKQQASLRVMASIQNVFVISKYRGLDPENSRDEGIDNNIYPRPRVFSLGLNLDF